ncbi:MAG: T9SS type A sorting domain-containing protein, partial [Candidatus Marinimicrobia bacterium]|nr:T9SS type A sorting domain-containing protein [Candidatus Neomarinimicrobiota bacterium]
VFLLIAFTRLSTSDFGLIIGSFYGLLAAQSISYLFRSNEPNWSDSTHGEVLLTETGAEEVIITNSGNADILVSGIHITGADSSNFFVDSTAFSMAPTDTVALDLVFVADLAGEYSASLQIESDGGDVSVLLMANLIDPAPGITFIIDVPNDQGGWVELHWDASGLDASGDITSYGIWEYVPDSGWVSLGDLPAIQANSYDFQAHTLGDSSETGIFWTEFMVTAHTMDPHIYYESEIEQGYSVDNLAPATPTGFVFEISTENYLELTWDGPVDEDFQFFRMYRSLEAEFDPTEMDPYVELGGTSFTDSLIDTDVNYYYQLAAIDNHGNESDYSNEIHVLIVFVDPNAVPDAFALHQNYPNPFNPSTTLNYDLPEQAWVHLVVYDLHGREIITLVAGDQEPGYKTVIWNGINNQGKPVGSGIYMYRINTEQFSRTRKMILLK